MGRSLARTSDAGDRQRQATPSAYLLVMATQFAQARPLPAVRAMHALQSVQIVHQLRQESEQGSMAVRRAGAWLAELAA